MDRSVKVSGSFWITVAVMLLTLPLQWILAALVSAAFHELCHYGAIRLCAGKPQRLSLGSNGAAMLLPEMGRGKELFCTAAGPIGGFLLFFLFPVCPRIALCGLFQSLYNLLPIYPLDGGRVLQCLTAMTMKPAYAQWLCSFVQWTCIGILVAACIYASCFLKLGLLPLILLAFMLVKVKFANYPCKEGVLAVQ